VSNGRATEALTIYGVQEVNGTAQIRAAEAAA
jgi:hypothetical protein